MSDKTRAALLLIGSEITTGKIQDAHGKRLSSLLTMRGIDVHSISILPDSKEIDKDIERLAEAVDLILVTGGLGPTSDDLTREAVAKAAGVPLVFRGDLWASIEALFKGEKPAESNKRQAEIPDGFRPIENSCGTAPGFVGNVGNAELVALPGPRVELEAMVSAFLDRYLEKYSRSGPVIKTMGTLFLVPESLLEDTLAEIGKPGESWRTQAQGHRILFEFASPDRGSEIIGVLQEKLAPLFVRTGEETAASLLSLALEESGKMLVCAESCTGGLIGKMMTDLPGSSEVFWGSFVTYDNEAKRRLLSVSTLDRYGAVSRETVIAMCEGAIEISGADLSVAVSGVAGPGGGSDEKPVGTVWIGVKLKDLAAKAVLFRFRGDRNRVRQRAAVAAMLLCESELRGISVDNELFRKYT